jgi:hypothetical protein
MIDSRQRYIIAGLAEMGSAEFFRELSTACQTIAKRCDGSAQGRLAAIAWSELAARASQAVKYTREISAPFIAEEISQ